MIQTSIICELKRLGEGKNTPVRYDEDAVEPCINGW